MTATRSRKQIKKYSHHLKKARKTGRSCDFCKIKEGSPQFIEEGKYFKVVYNIFPYSVWDDQSVDEHLMLLPKMHTDTIADISANNAQEFVKFLGKYESIGYNVLARTPGSLSKSQAHQHTHLIKLGKKHIKALFFIRKPYFRIAFK